MIDELCPASVSYPDFPTDFPVPRQEEEDLFNEPFSLKELNMAIQKCAAKLGSAPGLDKIDNYLMSNLSQNFKLELLNAFNSIMREGSFPESWREIFILFIPTGTPHKFRPISLAQVPLKVLERMIQLRLVWWLEHNHRLPQCQFGFRKGKSCQDSRFFDRKMTLFCYFY